jgi:hypothetical protein
MPLIVDQVIEGSNPFGSASVRGPAAKTVRCHRADTGSIPVERSTLDAEHTRYVPRSDKAEIAGSIPAASTNNGR